MSFLSNAEGSLRCGGEILGVLVIKKGKGELVNSPLDLGLKSLICY